MKSLWFRELRPYPVQRLREQFGENAERKMEKLVNANILRPAGSRNADEEADIEEMLELAPDGTTMYAFNFCGVVYVEDLLIRCYPKYIRKGEAESEQFELSFRKAMRAVRRYHEHREQHIYSVRRGERYGNLLGIIRALLEDYAHHGLYRTKRHEYEVNGEGETDWQRTLERYQPVFVRAEGRLKPVYMERDTDRVRTDEGNFFRQVHMAVLNACSQIIRDMSLADLFPVRGIRFPSVKLSNLGSRRHILRRLHREYERQYAETRRQILALLIIFIERRGDERRDRPLTFFGTNAMNLVWEKALAEVLDNQLDEKIGSIAALPQELRRSYKDRDKKLIEIIGKPQWFLYNSRKAAETATLIPDTIAIHEDGFVIYDAKYYVPDIRRKGDGFSIARQPALESVTKQYLYQMAYKDFLEHFGLADKVQNVFVIPHEHQPHDKAEGSFSQFGEVDFTILSQYTGARVKAYYADADDVWQAYADGEKLVFKDGRADEGTAP